MESTVLRSLFLRNRYKGLPQTVRRIIDDCGTDESDRLKGDIGDLPILCRQTLLQKLSGREEWQRLHDSKVLTVTKLIQYMGFGYEPAWRVNHKRTSNQKLDSILLYGKTVEDIAIQVLRAAWEGSKYHIIEGFSEHSILHSHISKTNLPHQREYDSECYFSVGRPLYGTPDLVCINFIDEHIIAETTIVEIKCPYKHLCLLDLDDGQGGFSREKILAHYKEHAPHLSRNPIHIRKFLGHVLQVALYWYMAQKQGKSLGGGELTDNCKLVYFFPDIAANTYLAIIYNIHSQEWVFDDDSLDPGPYGFHVEDIIREYYEEFVEKSPESLSSFRSGFYPIFEWANSGVCDERLMPVETRAEWCQEAIQGMFSRGIDQISLLAIGGENTKEITSSAMDRFLEVRVGEKPELFL